MPKAAEKAIVLLSHVSDLYKSVEQLEIFNYYDGCTCSTFELSYVSFLFLSEFNLLFFLFQVNAAYMRSAAAIGMYVIEVIHSYTNYCSRNVKYFGQQVLPISRYSTVVSSSAAIWGIPWMTIFLNILVKLGINTKLCAVSFGPVKFWIC